MKKFEVNELRKAVGHMNMVKFGGYISRLRKGRDMPQSELADKLCVTRQAVSKWERGECFPDIGILAKIAEEFGVSVDTLLSAGGAVEEIADKGAIREIISIAPYLKASTLSAIAEKLAKHNIDISRIIELSEFMNDESIIKLFESNNIDRLNDELLAKLIPFLDDSSIYAIFERVMSGQNSAKLLEPLRPYIWHSLIETAWMHGVLKHPSESEHKIIGQSDGTGKVVMKNLNKVYPNHVKVVTDFNLEINPGEVIALVGPSGCGKSTTLRMIAGLEEISAGELYIDGKLMNNAHPKDRGLSMVFQNYALFPHMNVFENIAFGLKPAELQESEVKAKVEQIAEMLQIAHLLNYKPNQLSGGQKQRTAVARLLINENKLKLLDEPFSFLDAKLRLSMRIELIKLHKQFKAPFVYVTHNQEEAMAVADRIVVMRDGIIQQVGAPEELYAKPCNLFVAGFIGTPQMNFWEAEHNGRKIIKGVRPEHLYIDDAGEFSAVVQAREFFGEAAYLYCECEGGNFTVRVPAGRAFSSGDKLKIGMAPDKIYMFDKESELRIGD